MTEKRIRCSEDLESFVMFVINRNAQACAPLLPHNNLPSPRLCDIVCEYELVCRRLKILLCFYQRSLIPLAVGNKKCHCHGWQGRGAGSRYSIKTIIKNKKAPCFLNGSGQACGRGRRCHVDRHESGRCRSSTRCLVNPERSFPQSSVTMKAFTVMSDGAV